MAITNIRTGETKKIRFIVKYNGEEIDISGDVIRYMLKDSETDSDSNALVNKTADVVGQGYHGIADVILTKTETEAEDFTIGKKYYEVVWERSNGDEYVLLSGSVYVIGRTTDVF